MRIAQLVGGSDTGGQTGALAKAFEELAPDDEVRNVVASVNYLRYPPIGWQKWKSPREFRSVAKSVYDWSDICLFTNTLELYDALDGGQRKPIVLIHRGTRYRNNPRAVFQEGADIGAKQVVSTVDLLLAHPEGNAEWLPLITDIAAMQAIRAKQRRRRGKTLRISHAPTNRAIKGTESVIRAVTRLTEKYDVELDLIENVSWDECLVRKATADIFIDQMELGYGNNALEAWAMGIPCVAGATPDILTQMRTTFQNETLPMVLARPRTIYRVLERLVQSKSARMDAADIGMAHTQRFHSPENVIPLMQGLFRSVGPSKGGQTPMQARDELALRRAAGRYIPRRLLQPVVALSE